MVVLRIGHRADLNCSPALHGVIGFTNTFGVYQTYYKEQHPDTANSVISLIGGLQIAVQYISGLFVGRAVDRFGPKPVVAFGALFVSLSLSACSSGRVAPC